MKKFVMFLSFALVFSSVTAEASVKKSNCSKIGSTYINAGKKFTCTKINKILIWDKGTVVLSPVLINPPIQKNIPVKEISKVDFSQTISTDQGYYTDFKGPCDFDTTLLGQAATIQNYFGFTQCGGQMRINKYSLGKNRPTTTYSSALNFNNTESCKLITPSNVKSGLGYTTNDLGRNKWVESRKYPSPNTVIQLIPIYANDTEQPKNSPEEDYKFYLDYVKNWIDYSSDFGSNVQIRIPNSYIKMKGNISDYHLAHTQRWDSPNNILFNKDVVEATDPVIDFTGVNIAIVVAPARTKASVIGQATLGDMVTNEKTVTVTMSEYATLALNPGTEKYSNIGHPFWWLHELMHAGYGFSDHYGDTQQNLNTEYGMGWLTLMTPFGGDLTTWEKWILGFIKDSQVQCVTGATNATLWIAPSTVNTEESKAIIIPISGTKVVVVETLRPAGLYYKLPLQSQGALVYEVDLMQAEDGMGMKLSLPLGRSVTSDSFFMSNYPLKQGESTICNGYKITIVESGTFGDVVKIEKI